MATMTVQKLISELRKHPQRALVAWRDHDQSSDEVNGFVHGVHDGEPELLAAYPEMLEGRRCKKIVVIS
jgi:hypothetical protein